VWNKCRTRTKGCKHIEKQNSKIIKPYKKKKHSKISLHILIYHQADLPSFSSLNLFYSLCNAGKVTEHIWSTWIDAPCPPMPMHKLYVFLLFVQLYIRTLSCCTVWLNFLTVHGCCLEFPSPVLHSCISWRPEWSSDALISPSRGGLRSQPGFIHKHMLFNRKLYNLTTWQ